MTEGMEARESSRQEISEMTPTSDERREVAARLRALPIDTYAAIREWEKGGLFIDASLSDEADYSQIYNAVFGCFPAEYMHPGDHEELHDRLADLIDPTCHLVITDGGDISCGKCGVHLGSVLPSIGALPHTHYCKNCGCRVVTD